MRLTETVKNRTGKSTVNVITGFVSQFVILLLNFAVRWVFIRSLGYEYLGINSLFSSILTIMSVADLGFGSALGIALYASLANKNEDEIAGLMNFFKKVYLIIGLVMTVIGLGITPFVKYLVNTENEIPYLSIYFLFFLANTVSSYFIGYRTILIRADQKNYVVNNVTTGIKISKALLEAFVLFLFPKWFGLFPTFLSYLGIMVLATYAIGIISAIYTKKKYSYAFKKAKVSKEKRNDIITITKDLLIYRICNALTSPVDSVLISIFVGTLLLGIYSNYLLIFTTLLEFICLISRNVVSSVGNFVVERPLKEQKKLYFEMQVVYFAVIIFCVINFVSLASPFIQLVFSSENVLSMWVVFLLGFTMIFRCANELSIIFRETTRIYKKTKYVSLVNLILHILLSLLLGWLMGLEGILLGNIIAYFLTSFWFEIFALFRFYFKEKSIKPFLYYAYVIAITSLISVGMFFLTRYISSFRNIYFFVSAAISAIVSVASVFLLFWIDGFKEAFARIKAIVIKALAFYKQFISIKKIQIIILASYALVLTVLLIIRDIPGLPINKFVFLGLLVATIPLLQPKYAIMVILFTLPVSPSTAELYILLVSLVYFAIISIKQHKIKGWLIIFAVPTFLFIQEIILSKIYGSIKITNALRIFTLLSMLSVIYYDRKMFTKKHIYALMLGFLLLFSIIGFEWVFGAAYGITHKTSNSKWLTLPALFKEVRLGSSVQAWIASHAFVEYPFKVDGLLLENSNNIALISLVGIATSFALSGTSKKIEKILLLLMGLMFFVFGVWSLSRSFFILFAIFIVFSVVVVSVTKRAKVSDALIFFFGIVGIASLFLLVVPNLYQAIVQRFLSMFDNTLDGNRLTLLIEYSKVIFTNPLYTLFGVSCSNMYPFLGVSEPPHSNIIQFIGSYGVITLVMFVTFLVFSLIKTKRIYRLNSPYVLLYTPLLFAVLFTFVLQLFNPSIILITFIGPIICLSFINKDVSKEKEIQYYRNIPTKVIPGNKIKLAMTATSFGGGIGSYIKNAVGILNDDNFDVSFVYNPDTTEREISNFSNLNKKDFTTYQSKPYIKPIKLLKKFMNYYNIFDTVCPDIIYINVSSIRRSLLLFLAAKIHRSSYIIIHSHNAVNSQSKMPFVDRILRFIAGYNDHLRFSCSMDSGRVFFGRSFGKDKIDRVIKNFIDIDRFNFSTLSREKIRSELNISNDSIVLGMVGRLSEEKMQSFAIDLINSLPSNYKLVIVGDGPDKGMLEQKIQTLTLSDRVTLIPNTFEIEKYYCAFDIYCLPSTIEGLPFVGVEAQCSGLITLINNDLPKEVFITRQAIPIQLDLNQWKNYILNLNINTKDRLELSKEIVDAGFTKETCTKELLESIKTIAL